MKSVHKKKDSKTSSPQKHVLEKSRSQETVENPQTGRQIKVGGSLHQKLVLEGVIDPSNEEPSVVLQKHQKKLVKFMKKNRSVLAVHGTGTGKTITSIASALELLDEKENANVIIICPPSVLANWKKELKRFVEEIPENFYFFTFNTLICANPKEFFKLCKGAIVILDEAHNLRTTICEKKVLGVPKEVGKRSDSNLKCIDKAWKVILLTATPFVNNIKDLENLFRMILGKMDTKIVLNKFEDVEKFLQDYKVPISYFMPEVNEGFPKVEIENKYIKLKAKERERYEAIREGEDDDWTIKINHGMVFFNNMRAAGDAAIGAYYSPKINFIIDILEKKPRKSLIFSSFVKHGINILSDSLRTAKFKKKPQILEIIGNTSRGKRKRNIEEFNSDEDFKIMLISKAGQEGIDLKGCRNVFILEPGWNPAESEQAMARAIRYKSHEHLSKKDQKVHVYKLFLDDTIDTEMEDRYLIVKGNLTEQIYELFSQYSVT